MTIRLINLRNASRPALLALAVMFGPAAQVHAAVEPWANPDVPAPTISHVGSAEVVDIAAPNGVGVSVNHFGRFDVERGGVILNNSPQDVTSQVAGNMAGNAGLGGTPASLIINEVHSATASALLGPLEVAGAGADVIVSNPAGIYCDGCGFINANKVVLTTGMLNIDPLGGVAPELDERGVGISIGTQGVMRWPNSAPQLELYARSLLIKGPIEARRFTGMAGARAARPSVDLEVPREGEESEGDAHAVAIALTGTSTLRAPHVTLIATGKGAGIHARGVIDAGELRISAGGELRLAGATISVAPRDGVPPSVGPEVSAPLAQPLLEAQAEVSAFESPHWPAEPEAPREVVVPRAQANLEGGTIELNESTVVVEHGRLFMHARDGSLRSEASTVRADTLVDVRARGDIVRSHGRWYSGGNLVLHAAGLFNVGADFVSQREAALDLGRLVNAGAAIEARTLRVDATTIDNRGGMLRGNAEVMIHADKVDNRKEPKAASADSIVQPMGDVLRRKALPISPKGLRTVQEEASAFTPGVIASGGAMAVHLSRLDNGGGTIESKDALGLGVRRALGNVGGTIASKEAKLVIDADGSVDNTRGHLRARRDLELRGASSVTNDAGSITSSEGNIVLDLSGGGASWVSGAGAVRSRALGSEVATIEAGGSIGVFAAEVDNARGLIHGQRVDLRAAHLHNQGGTVWSEQETKATFDILRNARGRFNAASGLVLRGTEMPDGVGALRSGGDLRMEVLEIAADAQSSIRAAGDVQITGDHIRVPEGAKVQADKHLTVLVEALENAGTLESASNLRVRARRRIRNVDGMITSTGGDVDLELGHGHLFNIRENRQGGEIVAGHDLHATCGVLENDESMLKAGGAMSLKARGALKNEAGALLAGSTLEATVDGAVNNTAGLIAAPERLAMHAGGPIDNRTGQIRSVAGDEGEEGAEGTGRVIVETPRSLFDNGLRGMLWARGPAFVSAGEIENGSGLIRGTDVTVSAADVRNGDGGKVKADREALTLHARTLDNSGGKLRSVQALTLQLIDARNSARGSLRSREGPLWVTVEQGSFDRAAGSIEAGPGGVHIESMDLPWPR